MYDKVDHIHINNIILIIHIYQLSQVAIDYTNDLYSHIDICILSMQTQCHF